MQFTNLEIIIYFLVTLFCLMLGAYVGLLCANDYKDKEEKTSERKKIKEIIDDMKNTEEAQFEESVSTDITAEQDQSENPEVHNEQHTEDKNKHVKKERYIALKERLPEAQSVTEFVCDSENEDVASHVKKKRKKQDEKYNANKKHSDKKHEENTY